MSTEDKLIKYQNKTGDVNRVQNKLNIKTPLTMSTEDKLNKYQNTTGNVNRGQTN